MVNDRPTAAQPPPDRRRPDSGWLRVGSNYLRLVLGVVLGLIVVRLLLRSVRDDGYGLIALLGQTVGFAAMLQDIVRDCMIRELGVAYHRRDPSLFVRVFNSAMVVGCGLGIISLFIFAALFWLIPFFNIPESLHVAARWFIVASACETFVSTLTAAHFNMYLVSERMVAYNFWLLIQRVCTLTAAGVVLMLSESIDHATGVMYFGFIASGLWIVSMIAASLFIARRDCQLIPRWTVVTGKSLRDFLAVGVWQAAVVTANNLHLRLDAIIMNFAFGLSGSRLFGLSSQLASYVRVLTGGTTRGIDAVAARIESSQKNEGVQRFLKRTTRLASFVAIPAGLAVFILAQPALEIWVGDQLTNPDQDIPKATMLVRILALGVTAWGIGDGWVKVLYGSGYVRKYALLLLCNGLMNPLLACTFLFILPQPMRLAGPCLAFTATFVVLYFGGMSWMTSRLLKMPLSQIYAAMAGPAIATAVCAPILILFHYQVQTWNLVWLGFAAISYGLAYVALSWRVVLTLEERHKITNGMMRRIRTDTGRKPQP